MDAFVKIHGVNRWIDQHWQCLWNHLGLHSLKLNKVTKVWSGLLNSVANDDGFMLLESWKEQIGEESDMADSGELHWPSQKVFCFCYPIKGM